MRLLTLLRSLAFTLIAMCVLSGCQQILNRLADSLTGSSNQTASAPAQPAPALSPAPEPGPPSEPAPVLPTTSPAQTAPQAGTQVQASPPTPAAVNTAPKTVAQTPAAKPSPPVQEPAKAPSTRTSESPQMAKPAPAAPSEVAAVAPQKALRSFRDCADCPLMIQLPAGSFVMGSPATEKGRDADESPMVKLSMTTFAIGQTEITRGQWRAFEAETGHRAAAGCLNWEGDGYNKLPNADWQNPGYPQTDQHPVVCVSWLDAQAYAEWLSRKTGQRYRLPKESEWEYAARSGSPSAYAWKEEPQGICAQANAADASLVQQRPRLPAQSCKDGFAFTAPVGSFAPNAWGVYDMHGNVMEWVGDCWQAQLPQNPDQAAPLNCRSRSMRGGGWDLPATFARSAYRGKASEGNRGTATGFRLAREMP